MNQHTLLAGLLLSLFLTGCAQEQHMGSATDVEWFADEAPERGITFKHLSSASGGFNLPELMGGGVALFDADGDEDLDIYFVQSGELFAEGNRHPNELYLNDGDGYFSLGEAADASKNLGYGMGVTHGDYDNDGDIDLFVTNLGRNALLQNDGTGVFTDVAVLANILDKSWSTSAAFSDFDNDGDLDLFVVNYMNWSPGIELECYHPRLGSREYCAPIRYSVPAQDRVYVNNGDGTFEDATFFAGLSNNSGNGLGIVTADFNNDGLTDVFVANDSTPNHLWLNQGNFKFTEEALAWNCAVDANGQIKAGMGVVTEDFDYDLDQDILVVNLISQTDTLFANGTNQFIDATASFGLATDTQRFTRFGVVALDFDNDSWTDLVHANGAIVRSPEVESTDQYAEPNAFYRGDGEGRITIAYTSRTPNSSRGLAKGDLNNDGRVDLVVANRDGTPSLLMNQLDDSRNWLGIRLLDRNNREAIGATLIGLISSRQVLKTVSPVGSYLSSNDSRLHIGLGDEVQFRDVVVRWKSGRTELFGDLAANAYVTLKEGSSSLTE